MDPATGFRQEIIALRIVRLAYFGPLSTVDYILFLAGAQGLMLALALVLSGINKRPANIHLGILIMVCTLELLNAILGSLQREELVSVSAEFPSLKTLVLPLAAIIRPKRAKTQQSPPLGLRIVLQFSHL